MAIAARSRWRLQLTLVVCGLAGVVGVFLFMASAQHSKGPAAPHEGRQPVAVFIGDSYSQGAEKWPSMVAQAQGWREVNLARGGTGYGKQLSGENAKKGCGLNACANFAEMVSVAIQQKPDIVVVAGGRNDGGADITTRVDETFRGLRKGLPQARIIAVQPMWDATQYPDFLVEYGALIKQAVESIGGQYLEIGMPLEGRPDLVRPDGVHPTKEGQAVLGHAINNELTLQSESPTS